MAKQGWAQRMFTRETFNQFHRAEAALFDPKKQVLTVTAGLETEILLDFKVVWRRLEGRAAGGRAVGENQLR